MKNEDKIVDLLSELVQKQDTMVGEISGLRNDVSGLRNDVSDLRNDVSGLRDEQRKTNVILSKHEKILNKHERNLLKIIDLLEQDVPRYDKVVKIEQLPEERWIIRKLPSASA